jgi:hypothetical protein
MTTPSQSKIAPMSEAGVAPRPEAGADSSLPKVLSWLRKG